MTDIFVIFQTILLVLIFIVIFMQTWHVKLMNRRDDAWFEHDIRKGSKGEELPSITTPKDELKISEDEKLLMAKYDEERQRREQQIAKDAYKEVEQP